MLVWTKIVGFFPGRAMGPGEGLPKGFALKNGHGARSQDFWFPADDRRRFGPIRAIFVRGRCPTRAISVADDAVAPEAGRRLLGCRSGSLSGQQSISPADLGRKRLSHFGFLRPVSGEYFWIRISAWILQDIGDMAIFSKGVSSREATLQNHEWRLHCPLTFEYAPNPSMKLVSIIAPSSGRSSAQAPGIRTLNKHGCGLLSA